MTTKASKTQKNLVLLDAHAIIHRAYHALPDFSSSSGEPTGALYGLSTMLMKIITELKPDYIFACYDLPGKTFRHEAYDEYKAKRVKADEALVKQLIKSREIFEAFGIPIYDSPGFEADDILGTIVEKLKKDKNAQIIIASGDMDTMQLVDGNKVKIYTLKKGITDTILYDEDAVVARFGFPPKLLPDFKGLRGDPSDNIIGIRGIGEKTASTLISKFGTIEDIYKKLKKSPKSFEEAGLSPRVISLLKEGEEEALFSKTLAKIRGDAPVNFSLPEKNFWQAVDSKKVGDLFSKLEFRSLLSKLPHFFNGTGAKSSNQSLPLPTNKEEQVPERKLQEASIALWLTDSDIASPTLAEILMFTNSETFAEAEKKIFAKLKESNLEKVFTEIEKPIMDTVAHMEERGIVIDRKYFAKLSKEYHFELDKISAKIYKLSGTEFNLNSPKQLGEVLFEKMGIKSSKKRKQSGSFSTNIEVLEELALEHPIGREIIKYRELQKLLSTYIDVIPGKVASDGRLHAKFLQNGSTTGRFSSQEPNLQNLPIKSELGKRIREGVVAASGHKLLALDYSQIELRVAAILSGDKKMTAIFKEKKDIHTGVASYVFGVPLEKVDGEMRRRAKVINFGIIYGMGVSALQKNLGGTREEAQKFYDNYFNQFAGVRDYLETIKNFAAENKYTLTLFGRRRNFPNINSQIPFLRSLAIRTATNAPLQGTAADIIKLAIRYAEEDLEKAKLLPRTHLILQIHDELVYEVEEAVLPQARAIIEDAMRKVLSRSYLKYQSEVPLEVHSYVGQNLGEVK